MKSSTTKRGTRQWMACIAMVAAILLVTDCDKGQRSEWECVREVRRDRALRLINAKYVASEVVHTNRSVADLRLDATYTTIERGTVLPEVGVYDVVWMEKHNCFYAFVQYYVDLSDQTFEFIAAWPTYDSDTLRRIDTSQCVYMMIEHTRARLNNADTTTAMTMVMTNVESLEDIRGLLGHSMVVLHQQRVKIEVSYELLGCQPLKFLLGMKINGKELQSYLPSANVSY